jgi:hypothetical protein
MISAYIILKNILLLVANLTSMSLVHEMEEATDSESNHVAGVHNLTLPQMAPHFLKPNFMKHMVKKPAGSTVVLSCPTEGEYIYQSATETDICWLCNSNSLQCDCFHREPRTKHYLDQGQKCTE